MGVSVGGDKQPAIGSVLTDTPHPVPDSEWLAVLLNALQVANSLDVVGQHGTNGDGRFLNFLFNPGSLPACSADRRAACRF